MKLETETICVSGTVDASYFDHLYKLYKDPIQLAQERGQWPYPDGLYKAWFDCKVIDKFTKDRWFGGRKYYFVVQIGNTTQEMRVDESNYYNDGVNKLHMYSDDGKNWYPTRK